MSETPSLPKFAKPPVVETILGVHFRPLEKFTSAHQGLLWEQCFRERFPEVEERPPVDEVREAFGEETKSAPALRWQVSDRLPAPRLWAASADGEHIVQIQRNAFLANWQKTDEGASYRSYETRRADFDSDLKRVDEFLRQGQIGSITPTSCIVTYINHIDCSELADLPLVLERMLELWTNKTSDGWLPALDKLNLHFGFPMPEERGRLNVQITPAVRRSDKRHLLRVDLTARGTPAKRELASAMDWIDLGHEWVVRGFASITRDEMHKLWERIQ